jgi:galactonate dehydratase
MNRRQWITAAGAAVPAFAVPPEAASVAVTGLEIFSVKVNRRGNWVLFRLTTSTGVTGIGDASHGGKDELVMTLGRRFLEFLKGRSIFDIEWLRKSALPEVERTGRPAAVALGGLEQCLWDLQGKVLQVPVYQLFGGLLERRIRTYANINRSTEPRTPAGFAAMAERAVKAGFDAIKLAPFDGMPRMDADPASIGQATDLAVECIRAVREVIGPKGDVLIDVHSHMNLERGLALARRLEPFRLFWLEEVCRPLECLAAINREANMPTAGGESLFGVKAFYRYITAGAADIVMPDIKYCGGMFELKKIAAMAEGAGLPVSPHGPASPVGNMAAAHVCATLPNFLILEHSFGEVPWREALVEPAERIERGYLMVSDRPGLGLTLNEKTVRRYAA